MAGNVFDVSLDWYLQAKKQLEEADKNNDETLRAQAEYDMGQARELLQKNLQAHKSEINSIGKDGKLPLQKAIWTQDKEIVDEFIRAGADVRAKDASGNTVMHTGVYSGTVEIVSTLLKTEAYKDINEENDNGKTPLSLVTGNTKDDDKKRSMLLQYGAEGHASNLDATIEHAMSNATGQHREAGMNALKNMVKAGTLNEGYLFDHLAKENDPEVFKQKLNALKEAGVDLSAKDAKSGDTLLHRIAGSGNKEMILAAKEAGVDAGIKNNNGETPDHVAARSGNTAASSALGTWKINEPDNNGRTPLMIAAEKGDVDQFNQLLALGGDPRKVDNDGKSCLLLTDNKEIAKKCIQEGVTNHHYEHAFLSVTQDSDGQSVDYHIQNRFHMTYQDLYNESVNDAAMREDIAALKKMKQTQPKMMDEFVKTERKNYVEGQSGIALQVLSENDIYKGADSFGIDEQNKHLDHKRENEAEAFAQENIFENELNPTPNPDSVNLDVNLPDQQPGEALAATQEQATKDLESATTDIAASAAEAMALNAAKEQQEEAKRQSESIMQKEEENRRALAAAQEVEKKEIMVHGYSAEAYVHAQTRLDGLVKKDPKMAKTVDNLRKNYKEMEEKGLLPRGENGQSNADIYAYKMCIANSLAHPEEKVKDANTGKKISFKEQVGGNHRDVVRRISDGKPLTEEEEISIARTTLGVEQQISDKGQLISNNGVKGMSYNTKALAGSTVKLEEVELSAPITPENKSMMAQNDPKDEKPEEKAAGKESSVSAPNLPGKLTQNSDASLTNSYDSLTVNSDGMLELNNDLKRSSLTQLTVFDKGNSYS